GEGGDELAVSLRALAVRAAAEDRALGLDRRRVAERAPLGHVRRGPAIGSLRLVRRGRDGLRDDGARAPHDDAVAAAGVLPREVLLAGERRGLDGDAADVDALERRERVEVAELADVPVDRVQARDGRRGRELPGDRPARVAPDDAEPALELEVVHLHDDAVDL